MPKKIAPTIRDPGDLFQRDTRTILDAASRIFITNGILLTDIALTTTTKPVSHGLNRIPRGFFVVDRTGDFRVYRDASKIVDRTTFLFLKASAACTVSLWVF